MDNSKTITIYMRKKPGNQLFEVKREGGVWLCNCNGVFEKGCAHWDRVMNVFDYLNRSGYGPCGLVNGELEMPPELISNVQFVQVNIALDVPRSFDFD